jgi:hypothetical protein
MNWSRDLESGALYFQLEEILSLEQREIAPGVIVDLGRERRPVGVEVLGMPRPGVEKAILEALEPSTAEEVCSLLSRIWGQVSTSR